MRTVFEILFCFVLISFLSCSEQKSKEYAHIEKYFKDTHKFHLDSTIDKIVVITEGTGCIFCDRSFSKIVLEKFQNKNTVILSTATGTCIDIQPFLAIEKNCFFDWQLNKEKYPEFVSSRIIFLKNKEIDTVIVINSTELMQQLEFLKTIKN
jgi:hypothetical protein